MEVNILKEKLRDLEDRLRLNNLRIDGVSETSNESSETSKLRTHELIKENIGITDDIHLERAHRCSAT